MCAHTPAQLVKAREVERKKAIAEGKMDDPLVPKRLEDAISMVGTCMDMCPRFERYRRERENNLTEWETIPGTKRVDHKRAVKMYERAAGDKTLPSDLRPPIILKVRPSFLFNFSHHASFAFAENSRLPLPPTPSYWRLPPYFQLHSRSLPCRAQ